jgi:hypothetical protein
MNKIGLIRGVTSLEGNNLYFTISVHMQYGISVVVFGGSGLITGELLYPINTVFWLDDYRV